MPSVVYHSGAENFRGLLSGVSERKPCKKKILAFINAPCKLLVERRLIAYPSQACSVSHSHTARMTKIIINKLNVRQHLDAPPCASETL